MQRDYSNCKSNFKYTSMSFSYWDKMAEKLKLNAVRHSNDTIYHHYQDKVLVTVSLWFEYKSVKIV